MAKIMADTGHNLIIDEVVLKKKCLDEYQDHLKNHQIYLKTFLKKNFY